MAQDIRPEDAVSLGVEASELRSISEHIRIYPNPVRNYSLVIESKLKTHEQIDWALTDLRGVTLDKGHLSMSTPFTLSLLGYEDGLYYLVLKKHDQRLLTRKIIVEGK